MAKVDDIGDLVAQLKQAQEKGKTEVNQVAVAAASAKSDKMVDQNELTRLSESLKQVEERTKKGFAKMKEEITKQTEVSNGLKESHATYSKALEERLKENSIEFKN